MGPMGDGLPDREIIARVIQGDAHCFELLLDRYRLRVLGIVGRHVPSHSVEDVSQEVFLEVYRSLGSFSGRSPLAHWISRIAVRCCVDFWRRHRGRELPMSSISEDGQRWMDSLLANDSVEDFQKSATAKEAQEVLEFALTRLSAEERTVLTLVHLDGLSVKEAADMLGWTSVLVKVRAHRSRCKLRKIIENLVDGSGGVP
ncbi:MAG: sigma-70 family RNA polymerase sigma factor [Deltaproteobacteria bacterium]|nr:sigma-70 family RNA polymerase sigma factor [Deltaproteobacteria bacterium]